MFDDFINYPKPKVRLFLKYLTNAARNVESIEAPEELKFSNRLPIEEHFVKESAIDNVTIQKEIDDRLSLLTNNRREELETKINALYTRNQFLPFEVRLGRIREDLSGLKNKYPKRKIFFLRNRIKKCYQLLRLLKKSDVSSH